MKRVSEIKKEQVKALLKCGKTGLDISDQVGISLATINKIRKELERTGFDIWHRPGVVSKYI